MALRLGLTGKIFDGRLHGAELLLDRGLGPGRGLIFGALGRLLATGTAFAARLLTVTIALALRLE